MYQIFFRPDTKQVLSVTHIQSDYIRRVEYAGLKRFYDLTPGFTVRGGGEWLEYEYQNTLNMDGLNERYDYPITPPAGSFRILTVGDSFTIGQYVNTDENYPEKLEDLFQSDLSCRGSKKIEVINLGVSGYDPEYTVARYIKTGQKYRPDLIIWLLTKHNLANIKELTDPLYDKCLNEEGYESADPLSVDNKQISHGCWVETVRSASEKMSANELLDYQENVINRLFEQYDGRLLIITFADHNTAEKQFLERIAAKRPGIIYFGNLDSSYSEKEILPDRHPTSAGYSIISSGIYSYLKQQQLVSCSEN